MAEHKKKKGAVFSNDSFLNSGRGERIRTSDSYVPNVVLYQAELHPEFFDRRRSICCAELSRRETVSEIL